MKQKEKKNTREGVVGLNSGSHPSVKLHYYHHHHHDVRLYLYVYGRYAMHAVIGGFIQDTAVRNKQAGQQAGRDTLEAFLCVCVLVCLCQYMYNNNDNNKTTRLKVFGGRALL